MKQVGFDGYDWLLGFRCFMNGYMFLVCIYKKKSMWLAVASGLEDKMLAVIP